MNEHVQKRAFKNITPCHTAKGFGKMIKSGDRNREYPPCQAVAISTGCPAMADAFVR